METLFVGRNIIFLPEVDSTNSYAMKLLKNVNSTVAEGSVIHAANQTNGRGQRGNVWNTKANCNLTASVILKPGFLEIKKQFYLYQITALACHDVMSELLGESQFDIKIKWPNDILVNGSKIAGILIENILLNNQLGWSIAGIGINVNQLEFEKGINATSLKLLMNKEISVKSVLESCCKHLEKYYLLLRNKKMDLIEQNYYAHFFKLNSWQNFEIEGNIKARMVKGVSDSGLLMLSDKTGNSETYDVKEARWVL